MTFFRVGFSSAKCSQYASPFKSVDGVLLPALDLGAGLPADFGAGLESVCVLADLGTGLPADLGVILLYLQVQVH